VRDTIELQTVADISTRTHTQR